MEKCDYKQYYNVFQVFEQFGGLILASSQFQALPKVVKNGLKIIFSLLCQAQV